MDTSKLEVGMRVKNYKVLCELLGEKVKGGKSKVLQLQDLERYIKYEKDGNAFIIKDVHSEPKHKVNKRPSYIGAKNPNRKDFGEFKIPEKLERRNGIYKIIYKNDIYIGSTLQENGFRNRFLQHRHKNNTTYTRTMLLNGGKFEILWMCEENLEDEYIVRTLEEYFIRYYKENSSYNVINTKNVTNLYNNKTSVEERALGKGWFIESKSKSTAFCTCTTCGYQRKYNTLTLRSNSSCLCPQCNERLDKNTYKNIKIPKENYDRAVEILKMQGIKIL